MSELYNHKVVEKKWQKVWDDNKAFAATDDYSKPKYYALVEFPYPSGQGLHVGHPRPYTALDIVARKRRMQGYNVLYPMGWDAFGLPTENYAIKNKIHPKIVTENNVKRFKEQLHSLGYSFDWDREINTTDPSYYKWTQWIFLKLFKAGLAYKKEMPINWCTSCKVGLANEEVVNGVCERCGAPVVRKVKSEWMLKITDYAEKLLEGLNDVDYIERVKVSQKNWIGKSQGAEVDFAIAGKEDKLRVYTTRCDTLFGATYMVVSPEHPIIDKYKDELKNWDAIAAYREEAAKKSDFERSELAKDKTGVEIDGLMAVNPVTGKEIPIWISDYVLMSYGTGAIMAVPAHDERDWEFAKKFGCEIIEVVSGGEDVQKAAFTAKDETGILVNSDFLNGLTVKDAIPVITKWLEEKGIGEAKVNYKLRDWVFSRQRYWGEPIPIIHCPDCGNVPVPEEELPLTLPDVESYEPTGTGESPLAGIEEWVNCTCPVCGKPAKRETNTMPQWAGSSWYFLRYVDSKNDKELVSREKADEMLPVDMYIGGVEHAVLHLLYSRFYTKFLYDIGVVDFDEPFHKLFNQGMITGKNGIKMSKSKGNAVDPFDALETYGADAIRWYFYTSSAPWIPKRFSGKLVQEGQRKFMGTLWNTYAFFVLYANIDQFDATKYTLDYEKLSVMDKWLLSKLNSAIKGTDENLANYRIPEAAKVLDEFVDDMSNWYVRRSRDRFWAKGMEQDKINAYMTLYTALVEICKAAAPMIPFMTEEIYQNLVRSINTEAPESIHLCDFPAVNDAWIDKDLEKNMDEVLKIVVMGRACRNSANIKNRQPIGNMYVKAPNVLPEYFVEIIEDELNVKKVNFTEDVSAYTSYTFKPQLRTVGPKYGKFLGQIQKALAELDGNKAMAELKADGVLTLPSVSDDVKLSEEDLLITMTQMEGYVTEGDNTVTVVLDTNLTPELVEEGFVREIISKIQTMRKEAGFEVMDKISIYYHADEKVADIFNKYENDIMGDVLGTEVVAEADSFDSGENGIYCKEWNINGEKVLLGVKKGEN